MLVVLRLPRTGLKGCSRVLSRGRSLYSRAMRYNLLFICCSLFLVACRSVPHQVKIESILRTQLSDEIAPDREVIMSYVEIPPDTSLPWHWHPGEEFAYILEGDLTAHFEGERDAFLAANEAAHIPLKAVHTVTTGSRGARLLVVRIHMSGEPERHVVEAPQSHAHD
ncbi:MAG: quercetin dioxygenase-like cupin family protein [Planctomycetota bacterium]|jgi:quercetin dioxygenase-like cupin family protein